MGEILQAKIKEYNKLGAIVAITKNVDGFVPLIHLTDTSMENPERKHPVGTTVTGRVFRKNERTKLHLTFKSQLVSSELPLITEYSKNLIGTVSHGTIIVVNKKFLILELFNEIRGIVPRSKASAKEIQDLTKIFRIGQVLQCRIAEVDPEEKKMTLSLQIDGLKSIGALNKNKESQKQQLKLCQKVNCTVTQILGDVVKVLISDQNLPAEIPMYHISDDLSICEGLIKILQPGDEIKDALVFRNDITSITLTLKSSVYNWLSSKGDVLVGDDIVEGELVPTAVDELRPYGVMVIVPKGKWGSRQLIHKSCILDKALDDINKIGLRIGQTLIVNCLGRNKENKPKLSSKLYNVTRNSNNLDSLSMLVDHFDGEDLIMKGLEQRGSKFSSLNKYSVGDTVDVTVSSIADHGLTVKIENSEIEGIITKDHLAPNKEYSEDDKLEACVIYVDPTEKFIYFTLMEDIKENLHYYYDNDLEVGQNIKCSIIFMHQNFVIGMLKGANEGIAVYLPAKKHINDLIGMHSLYRGDKTCSIVVKHIKNDRVFGIIKSQNQNKELTFTQDRPQLCLSSEATEIEFPNESIDEKLTRLNVHSISLEGIIEDGNEISQIMKENRKDVLELRKEKRKEKLKEARKLRKEENGKIKAEKEANPDEESDKTPTKKKAVTHKERRKEKLKQKKLEKQLKRKLSDGDSENVDSSDDAAADADSPNTKRQCLELDTKGFVWDVPDEEMNSSSSDSNDDEESNDETAGQTKVCT